VRKKVKGEKLGRQFWFFSKGRGVCFVFKKDERGGRSTTFLLERIGLGFFFVFSLFSEKLLNIFLLPFYYGWRFTYIENIYTCYSRKYYNNYCRGCLL
jgi:hypothetical protein